jgi:hypothetical protein
LIGVPKIKKTGVGGPVSLTYSKIFFGLLIYHAGKEKVKGFFKKKIIFFEKSKKSVSIGKRSKLFRIISGSFINCFVSFTKFKGKICLPVTYIHVIQVIQR